MNRTLLGIDRKMGTFPDSVKATRRLPDLHGRIGNRSGLCAVPTAGLKERSRPRARPDAWGKGPNGHVWEASQRIVALNEAARKAADEKAWADAEKAGTAAAYTAYIQNFGGGAHVAEARQRVAELSRKEADDKAWADAKLGQLD